MRALIVCLALLAWPAVGQQCAPTSSCLSWTPPTQNTDGSPLTDLAGYKVYRGSSPTSFSSSVTLSNPVLASYVWTSLPVGTSYFAVTAFNTANAESSMSNVTSKTVSGTQPPTPTTIAGPVFNLGITQNSMVLLEAGSVVAGRPCDRTQQIAFSGQTYMRVDVAHVTPFAGQQILAAWARCQ